MSGLRHNKGKLPFHLDSPVATIGRVKVLEFGMRKYAARNWEKGLSWGETLASLKRHISDFEMGIDIDHDSKLPTIHHVQVNAMFLAHFYEMGTGTDDREKYALRLSGPQVQEIVGQFAPVEEKIVMEAAPSTTMTLLNQALASRRVQSDSRSRGIYEAEAWILNGHFNRLGRAEFISLVAEDTDAAHYRWNGGNRG